MNRDKRLELYDDILTSEEIKYLLKDPNSFLSKKENEDELEDARWADAKYLYALIEQSIELQEEANAEEAREKSAAKIEAEKEALEDRAYYEQQERQAEKKPEAAPLVIIELGKQFNAWRAVEEGLEHLITNHGKINQAWQAQQDTFAKDLITSLTTQKIKLENGEEIALNIDENDEEVIALQERIKARRLPMDVIANDNGNKLEHVQEAFNKEVEDQLKIIEQTNKPTTPEQERDNKIQALKNARDRLKRVEFAATMDILPIANLIKEKKEFIEAVHALYPDKKVFAIVNDAVKQLIDLPKHIEDIRKLDDQRIENSVAEKVMRNNRDQAQNKTNNMLGLLAQMSRDPKLSDAISEFRNKHLSSPKEGAPRLTMGGKNIY